MHPLPSITMSALFHSLRALFGSSPVPAYRNSDSDSNNGNNSDEVTNTGEDDDDDDDYGGNTQPPPPPPPPPSPLSESSEAQMKFLIQYLTRRFLNSDADEDDNSNIGGVAVVEPALPAEDDEEEVDRIQLQTQPQLMSEKRNSNLVDELIGHANATSASSCVGCGTKRKLGFGGILEQLGKFDDDCNTTQLETQPQTRASVLLSENEEQQQQCIPISSKKQQRAGKRGRMMWAENVQAIPHINDASSPTSSCSKLEELDLSSTSLNLSLCRILRVWDLRLTKRMGKLESSNSGGDDDGCGGRNGVICESTTSEQARQYHPSCTIIPHESYGDDGPLSVAYQRVFSIEVFQINPCEDESNDNEDHDLQCHNISTSPSFANLRTAAFHDGDTQLRQIKPRKRHHAVRRIRIYFYNKYADAISGEYKHKSSQNSKLPLIMSLANVPARCIFPYLIETPRIGSPPHPHMQYHAMHPMGDEDFGAVSSFCICIGDESKISLNVQQRLSFDCAALEIHLRIDSSSSNQGHAKRSGLPKNNGQRLGWRIPDLTTVSNKVTFSTVDEAPNAMTTTTNNTDNMNTTAVSFTHDVHPPPSVSLPIQHGIATRKKRPISVLSSEGRHKHYSNFMGALYKRNTFNDKQSTFNVLCKMARMKSENNSEPWVNLKNIESEPRSSKERCSGRLSIYVNRVHNVDEVKLVNAHICNLPGTLEVGRTVHVSHVGGKVETNTAPEVLSQEDNILLGPEVGAGKSSPQEDIIVQPDFRPPVLTLTSCPEGPLIHDNDIDNLKNLLERDPTPWVGLVGGTVRNSSYRLYTPSLEDFPELYGLVKKCMSRYIKLIQQMYPKLKYYKLSVLKSLNGAVSQYEGCQKRLHSDYHHNVNFRPPDERPISILVALDEFEFHYLEDRKGCRRDIITTKFLPKQMVAFTNYCLHAGGANNSGKVGYRLFAYVVSNEDDFPGGRVHHYGWKAVSADELDDVIEAEYQSSKEDDNENSVPTSISSRGRFIRKTKPFGST